MDEVSHSTRQIISLWRELLGAEQLLRPDDNFFSLGGDSLHVLTLVFQLQEMFGVEVWPGLIYDACTPRLLGQWLDEQLSQSAASA